MAPRKYTLGKRSESIEDTRRRIVDATVHLHSEKGVLATSMQDVAERANVALHTVYNHYPTIEDLVGGCGQKVIEILSPPTPAIFDGLTTVEERMLKLVCELFAMYERGSVQLEVARCEQSKVAGLADFVTNERVLRDELVGEALRPFEVRRGARKEIVVLTDFYVWKAFAEENLTTRQAVKAVYRSLMAVANPDAVGENGRGK